MVTVSDVDWPERREHRSPEERRCVERQLRMRWLDWRSGICYRISRRFRRIGGFWEARGDRACDEWESRAYWRDPDAEELRERVEA